MVKKLIILPLLWLATGSALAQITDRERPKEWDNLVAGGRFMDRFLRMPQGTLRSDLWGAEGVVPRFADNGIDDSTYSYWGGNIVLGDDSKYHMFVCGWLENSEKGHHMWPRSTVFHTVSDNLSGPYVRKGVVGAGHNPEIYRLDDGRYIVYVIDGYYIANNLDGEWSYAKFDFDSRDRPIIEGLSNLTFTRREDGSYLMVCRGGGIWISRDGISTYKQLSDRRVYPPVDGEFEDPVVWRDNVQYNLIVNDWLGRIAFYLRSKDGVNWVTDPGEAYTTSFTVHPDGKVEDWFKYERIKIFQDKHGRAVQANFAVIDVLKNDDKGNDNHSSKNVCVPLNPGMLLTILGDRIVTEKSRKIEVLILAEEGFDPKTEVDVSSLRFGSSGEVNFGRGAKVVGVEESAEDLIVTFNGKGSALSAAEFAPKMIGRTKAGKMIYGYARMPGVEFVEPILSARKPKFADGIASVVVENLGQVESLGRADITLSIVQVGGEIAEVAKGKVDQLKPYGQIVVSMPVDYDFKQGSVYEMVVSIKSNAVAESTFRFKSEL